MTFPFGLVPTAPLCSRPVAFLAEDVASGGMQLMLPDGRRHTAVVRRIGDAPALLTCTAPPAVAPEPRKLAEMGGGRVSRALFAGAALVVASVTWVSPATLASSLGTPYLVRDINPTGSSSPIGLTDSHGALFFSADDGTHGQELWKSDGTESGTVLVKDVSQYGSQPSELTVVDGTLFFWASVPEVDDAQQLWKSDGSPGGTVEVERYCCQEDSSLFDFTALGGHLLFAWNNSGQDVSLWRSDGTPSGTVELKDVFANACCLLTRVGDRAFFVVEGKTEELWSTDGTRGGTRRVKTMDPRGAGTPRGGIRNLAAYHHKLFFTANDAEHGIELWKSDGTAGGTVLVKDIRKGPLGSRPLRLTRAGSALFFSAKDGSKGRELWKTDGSRGGTVRVRDVRAGRKGSGPAGLTNAAGTLFLSANDGVHGRELWESDGTTAGTVRVIDLRLGSVGSAPRSLAAAGPELVFSADDGSHGREPWRSDGTKAGTTLLSDINPNAASSAPDGFRVSGSRVYFSADDGTHGRELWAMPLS